MGVWQTRHSFLLPQKLKADFCQHAPHKLCLHVKTCRGCSMTSPQASHMRLCGGCSYLCGFGTLKNSVRSLVAVMMVAGMCLVTTLVRCLIWFACLNAMDVSM